MKKAGEGAGKSGSFFFISHNYELIIKTMTSGELKTWKKIFKHYFNHVTSHRDSLLARIYGIYSVTMEDR